MSTVAAVRALPGGEFADQGLVTNAAITSALDLAATFMGAAAWGAAYAQGQTYLAAHVLKIMTPNLGGNTGNVGAVSSRSAGDLGEAYASPPVSTFAESVLGSTTYGAMWLALRNSRSARAPFAVSIR